MNSGRDDDRGVDPLTELRFALAEGEAAEPTASLRDRLLANAVAVRPPGRAALLPERIDGTEAYRRMAERFTDLITDLEPDDWARPAHPYGTVGRLIAHVVGVEEAFAAALAGGADPQADGVPHTELVARADDPTGARVDWQRLVDRTRARLSTADPDGALSFYGATTLTVDQLLVIRAFELWMHDEDVRRAMGQMPSDPDASTLDRMTDVALVLLPIAIATSGAARPGTSARLVLTGPGGGTWDVPLDPAVDVVDRVRVDARVVVDVPTFCRVVGGRIPPAEAGAVLSGDESISRGLLAAAATLALD